MAQFELLDSSVHPEPPRKSEGAYRTISEVSDELGVPQHVLRFWEVHFPQVKPSRMRGARRYYRPEDIDLLKKIKTLLYSQGYTIKGAKKVVRAGGDIAAPEAAALPQMENISSGAVADKEAAPHQASPPDVKALIRELRILRGMLDKEGITSARA